MQDELLRKLKACIRDCFPPVREMTDDDIPQVSRLDKLEYKQESIGETELREWYRKFRHGAFVQVTPKISPDGRHRVDQDIVMGAFGLWPVEQRTYDGIKNGRLTEEQVQIAESGEDMPQKYWYLSDVILSPQYRAQGLKLWGNGNELIYASLNAWSRNKWATNPFYLCAIPITKKSVVDTAKSTERLLKKHGFKSSKKVNADGRPGYWREMTSGEIPSIWSAYWLGSRTECAKNVLGATPLVGEYLKRLFVELSAASGGVDDGYHG